MKISVKYNTDFVTIVISDKNIIKEMILRIVERLLICLRIRWRWVIFPKEWNRFGQFSTFERVNCNWQTAFRNNGERKEKQWRCITAVIWVIWGADCWLAVRECVEGQKLRCKELYGLNSSVLGRRYTSYGYVHLVYSTYIYLLNQRVDLSSRS